MDMSDMCFWKWIPGGFSGPNLFGGCLRRVKVVSYCMMPTSCHCMVPLHRAPRASLNHRPTRQLRRGRTGRVEPRWEDVGLKSGDQHHQHPGRHRLYVVHI